MSAVLLEDPDCVLHADESTDYVDAQDALEIGAGVVESRYALLNACAGYHAAEWGAER